MNATTHNRPNLSERLASAGNSRDLTVCVETRGDADLLIAAGSSTACLGRYVYQLMTEWDGCARPKQITDEDLKRIASALPRVSVTKQGRRGLRTSAALDLAGARAKVDEWLAGERRRVLSRLHSLPKLMDPHSGLLPWVVARGGSAPEVKLLDVLGWWADRRCSACQGTKEHEGRVCKVCRGVGLRDIPHGREGQAISEHIAAHVDRARQGTRSGLAGLKRLKAYAAGHDGGRPGL